MASLDLLQQTRALLGCGRRSDTLCIADTRSGSAPRSSTNLAEVQPETYLLWEGFRLAKQVEGG